MIILEGMRLRIDPHNWCSMIWCIFEEQIFVHFLALLHLLNDKHPRVQQHTSNYRSNKGFV